MINLYEAIGLDRNEPTIRLRERLQDVRAGWTNKAARAGSLGERARSMLELITRADVVFRDDDSRDRYDLSLRREGPADTDAAQVDWLIRAWSYYFGHDDGAAAVAARKAREQDPNNAMAYVVSAWVKIRQEDLRTAQADADEAFVLDELGEDTADVHHVRGVVFHLKGDPDRALQSYERALAKASEGERGEIYVRMAWAQEKKQNWQEAFSLCVKGLEQGELLEQEFVKSSELTAARGIIKICDRPDNSAQSIAKYEERLAQIRRSSIRHDSKLKLIAFATANITRHRNLQETRRSLAALEATHQQLAMVQNANGSRPDTPLIAMGIAGFCLLLSFAWVGFLLVVIGVGLYVGKTFSAISEWDSARASFDTAQKELQATNQQEMQLRSTIRSLTQVISLDEAARSKAIAVNA
ncbi:MAG: hypothetical protein WBO89_12900 [Propionicimonas sp.]